MNETHLIRAVFHFESRFPQLRAARCLHHWLQIEVAERGHGRAMKSVRTHNNARHSKRAIFYSILIGLFSRIYCAIRARSVYTIHEEVLSNNEPPQITI